MKRKPTPKRDPLAGTYGGELVDAKERRRLPAFVIVRPRYTCIYAAGVRYTFCAAQARVVRVLDEAREAGVSEMTDDEILQAARLNRRARLFNYFRRRGANKAVHAAWGRLIVVGQRPGTRRLNLEGGPRATRPNTRPNRRTQ